MPWWQERTFWNLWGPRALIRRLRGFPLPSSEFECQGITFQAMGAPHKHPATQSAIEKRVVENAQTLETTPFGYRPAIGFQAARLMGPVDGPAYGDVMNSYKPGTPTTPNNAKRFTREYERREASDAFLRQLDASSISTPAEPAQVNANKVAANISAPHAFSSASMVTAAA